MTSGPNTERISALPVLKCANIGFGSSIEKRTITVMVSVSAGRVGYSIGSLCFDVNAATFFIIIGEDNEEIMKAFNLENWMDHEVPEVGWRTKNPSYPVDVIVEIKS